MPAASQFTSASCIGTLCHKDARLEPRAHCPALTPPPSTAATHRRSPPAHRRCPKAPQLPANAAAHRRAGRPGAGVLSLLPPGLLAEVLGLVPVGERGPARQACRALMELTHQAARRLRVACLPPGAGGGPEPAAVLRALRRRPGLEELVLVRSEGVQQGPHTLAILEALGPGGGGGGEGQQAAQPPLPITKLTLQKWLLVSQAAALGRALRPGGALSNVRSLELQDVRGYGYGSVLPYHLPPGLRVSVASEYSCSTTVWDHAVDILLWAYAERGGTAPDEDYEYDGDFNELLAAVEALPPVGTVAGQQGPATAVMVGLELGEGLCSDLARAVALLASLETLAVGGRDKYGSIAGTRGRFMEAVGHLARCPALRELRVQGRRQHLWAWAAQAVLAPRGVRCEVAGDVEGPLELDWPTLDVINAGDVQAAVQQMAGCARPPTQLELCGRWPWVGGARVWAGAQGGV
jgi:hypothetical protein